jgi:hypothetical protein
MEEGEHPELLFYGDLERGPTLEEHQVFKITFRQLVEVQQVRVVRGGTLAHGGLKESITQRGEEVEKLELFARVADSDRGFKLICSAEKISEKGNHDTIIPLDPNYTVYSALTSDPHRPALGSRKV